MTVEEIMDEYNLTIDDIRYYRAYAMAERFLTYQEEPHALAKLIWSGEVESELYNMADRFIEEKREELSRNLTDEARLRETLREALTVKRERRRLSPK